VFRFPSEKFDKRFVNLKNHVKANITIMVWGTVWRGGRSELIIMERDEDAPRRGYIAKSYQKALREGLLPHYDGTRHFQQDNARIHVCEATQTWLAKHRIEWMDWPPYSPDLNPIEHVWAALKRNLQRMFPDLWELKRNELNIEDFKEKLRAAWWAIDQALIDRLIDSLPRRLAAVKKARGWYTKY
jgi:transposase